MSLANILVPNNYELYGDFNGNITSTNIIYHTLTQDNALSHVDASGNAKLGNCEAAVIDCTNVVASTGITAGNLGVDTTGPIHCTGNITGDAGFSFGSPLGAFCDYNDTTGTFRVVNLSQTGTMQYANNVGLLVNGTAAVGNITSSQITSSVRNTVLINSPIITNSSPFTLDFLAINASFPLYICNEGVTAFKLMDQTAIISYCSGLVITDPNRYSFEIQVINNTSGVISVVSSDDGKVLPNSLLIPMVTNIVTCRFVIIDPTGVATPSVIMY